MREARQKGAAQRCREDQDAFKTAEKVLGTRERPNKKYPVVRRDRSLFENHDELVDAMHNQKLWLAGVKDNPEESVASTLSGTCTESYDDTYQASLEGDYSVEQEYSVTTYEEYDQDDSREEDENEDFQADDYFFFSCVDVQREEAELRLMRRHQAKRTEGSFFQCFDEDEMINEDISHRDPIKSPVLYQGKPRFRNKQVKHVFRMLDNEEHSLGTFDSKAYMDDDMISYLTEESSLVSLALVVPPSCRQELTPSPDISEPSQEVAFIDEPLTVVLKKKKLQEQEKQQLPLPPTYRPTATKTTNERIPVDKVYSSAVPMDTRSMSSSVNGVMAGDEGVSSLHLAKKCPIVEEVGEELSTVDSIFDFASVQPRGNDEEVEVQSVASSSVFSFSENAVRKPSPAELSWNSSENDPANIRRSPLVSSPLHNYTATLDPVTEGQELVVSLPEEKMTDSTTTPKPNINVIKTKPQFYRLRHLPKRLLRRLSSRNGEKLFRMAGGSEE